MQNELRECPFCGKKVAHCGTIADIDLVDDDSPDYDWSNNHHAVVCNYRDGGCGAATGAYDTKEQAIVAWNRRANEQTD